MTEIYIVAAIVYLMIQVKSPWWVIAGFIALMIADFVVQVIEVIKGEKKDDDEKGNL